QHARPLGRLSERSRDARGDGRCRHAQVPHRRPRWSRACARGTRSLVHRRPLGQAGRRHATHQGLSGPSERKAEGEMAEAWAEVAASRTELADLCQSLAPEQWDAQSLCDDWKVRDVVGHLVESTEKMGFGTLFTGMVKNGFNINKLLGNNGKEWGKKPTDELT